MKTFKQYLKENCCCVTALEKGLKKLDNHDYESINKLMMNISKKGNITGKDLHDDFVSKHGKTPDDWIKKQIEESKLNPVDPHKDYAVKSKVLQDLSRNKDVDQKSVQQRRLDLDKEYSKIKEESELNESSPAWQRAAGKDPEGGLNRKGIASYRRENPGSKLSMAVTTKPSKLKPGSKASNRRKSFCARMSGMKKRLTSAKTANDPDSRINKSLRKWNC
jgi:hypothetical protein